MGGLSYACLWLLLVLSAGFGEGEPQIADRLNGFTPSRRRAAQWLEPVG